MFCGEKLEKMYQKSAGDMTFIEVCLDAINSNIYASNLNFFHILHKFLYLPKNWSNFKIVYDIC